MRRPDLDSSSIFFHRSIHSSHSLSLSESDRIKGKKNGEWRIKGFKGHIPFLILFRSRTYSRIIPLVFSPLVSHRKKKGFPCSDFSMLSTLISLPLIGIVIFFCITSWSPCCGLIFPVAVEWNDGHRSHWENGQLYRVSGGGEAQGPRLPEGAPSLLRARYPRSEIWWLWKPLIGHFLAPIFMTPSFFFLVPFLKLW